MTNKNETAKQLALHERRETLLLRSAHLLTTSHSSPPQTGIDTSTSSDQTNGNGAEPLPYTDVSMHHHISDARDHPHHLDAFVQHLGTDPAGSVCHAFSILFVCDALTLLCHLALCAEIEGSPLVSPSRQGV